MNQTRFLLLAGGLARLRLHAGPRLALLDDHLLKDIGMLGADDLTLRNMGIQRIDSRPPRTRTAGQMPVSRL